ncbi:MAG: hypothetical protein PWQ35_42 [Patescibacteria group bacterium]|nr:hypothetical protein [Patescibacteria group bacterium]
MNIKKLPSLAQSTLAALTFFQQTPPPYFNLKISGLPFVVGSGNALNTGKIIFADKPIITATESNFKNKLKSYQDFIKQKIVKQAIIISASGEKDSVWELKAAQEKGLETILLTCNPQSSAALIANQVIVYQKIAEPQTYNISTYLGMILSKTKEKAQSIEKFVKTKNYKNKLKQYQAYSFIVPDKFADITPLLDIKKHELFGPYVSIRSFSEGEARHAKFVMPTKKELVISLGKNKYFGLKDHRLEIKMPTKYDMGLVFALCYFIIGQIQEIKPAYYQKNIARYCQEGPLAYGQKKPFAIIVE